MSRCDEFDASAWQNRERIHDPAVRWRLFDEVLEHTPNGNTRAGIERARGIGANASARAASGWLGNGSKVTCPDTVPFCLWAVAKHFNDYKQAIWRTVQAGGDVDTNAAIVGGVVALAVGPSGLPAEWLARREELG